MGVVVAVRVWCPFCRSLNRRSPVAPPSKSAAGLFVLVFGDHPFCRIGEVAAFGYDIVSLTVSPRQQGPVVRLACQRPGFPFRLCTECRRRLTLRNAAV
jgi:hypothetical protein